MTDSLVQMPPSTMHCPNSSSTNRRDWRRDCRVSRRRIGCVELDPAIELTLFEASDRLGGSLWTERRDGFLVEQGADSFITNVPWGVDLCRRLGLGDELIGTNPRGRKAFVVRRGRLVSDPGRFHADGPEPDLARRDDADPQPARQAAVGL